MWKEVKNFHVCIHIWCDGTVIRALKTLLFSKLTSYVKEIIELVKGEKLCIELSIILQERMVWNFLTCMPMFSHIKTSCEIDDLFSCNVGKQFRPFSVQIYYKNMFSPFVWLFLYVVFICIECFVYFQLTIFLEYGTDFLFFWMERNREFCCVCYFNSQV